MKKLLAISLLLLAVLGWQGNSEAVIGTIDAVPAATVLLPYFEVDLNNSNGQTTLFSINNASASAMLAHVVLWTDLGVPAFAFHIYLTGFDVQTLNLRDILNGNLPRTASAGQDPTDTISPHGPASQDINFASCTGFLPPPPLDPSLVTHLRNVFAGLPSAFFGNACAAVNHGDNIARGYVTVDSVNACTTMIPGDTGYFGASGVVMNYRLLIPPIPLLPVPPNPSPYPPGWRPPYPDYMLWGDYYYVNPEQNFAQGDNLVHIEADTTDSRTNTPGKYTFYGRYVGWDATDYREPLATNFAVRFMNGGAFNGGTNLIVWRDSKSEQNPSSCSKPFPTAPNSFPLAQEEIVIFDEQENPEVLPSTELPFPAAAMRTYVGGPDFPVTPNFGWLHLNLNTTVAVAGANPAADPAAAQAWVSTTMDAEGRFSVGFPAIRLDSAIQANHTLLAP